MRQQTKYEGIVYEHIHRHANKDYWPFHDLASFLNSQIDNKPLLGKEFLFVWQDEDEVFVKEVSCFDEFLNLPDNATQFSKHEIEMEWYEQNRTLVEC